ncbi:hypothetical protein ACTFIW_005737 [Dictyostelium discoideum]
MKKRVTIRFYVKKKLEYGQRLKVCGSVRGLGSWNSKSAIQMNWTENDWWTGEFQFEATSNLPKNNFKLETSSYYFRNKNQYHNNNNNNNNESFIDQQQINNLFSNSKKQNHLPKSSSSSSSSFSSSSYTVEEDDYFGNNTNTNNNNNNNNYNNQSVDNNSFMNNQMSSYDENNNNNNNNYGYNSDMLNYGCGDGSSNSVNYQLSNSQSLSPSLKGTSPQLIEFDYKYMYESYDCQYWEKGANHRVSFMMWSNDFSNEEEEIYIEIRDEYEGGNEVFPTLDYRSLSKVSSPPLYSLDELSLIDGNNNNNTISTPSSSITTTTTTTTLTSNNSNDDLVGLQFKYSFLQPLESQIIPRFPAQICTFVVMDEGDSEFHSVNLVSQFFGTDSQKSLRMYPVTRAGSSNTIWIGQIYSPQPMKFEYHYVVTSSNNRGIYWEKEKRTFSTSNCNDNLVINNDGMIKYSDVSDSWVKTGFVGLLEQDYNCSISCVVQLLYHIVPLRNIIKNLGGKIGFPFTQCLAKIFTSMEMGFGTTDISPLPNSIGSQDSAEILDIIVNALIEEISRISKNNNDYSLSIECCKLFEGEQQHTYVCIDKDGRINSMKTSNEKFVNIILPVKGFSSLEDSLEFYKHSEEKSVVGDGSIYESMNEFVTIPDVLIFQLDRTDYENRKTIKVSNNFSFPKSLDITSHNGDRVKFKIVGILCHSGSDFYGGGHFFLFIHQNNKFYKFDGSNVSISNNQEAIINNFGGDSNQTACMYY